ncbi:hypothetical protein [Frigoribacterium sp. UYMn621]|uniref:hypothetical protein n=1 Tax=Frigoribacterium sp. UYMn621 TaxID=3156343 RepID=UPI003392FD49
MRDVANRPGFWHLASLLVGLALILFLQRKQWFFFDEWAFIKFDGLDVFAPHVGHWSTSPILVYEALIKLVGLNSYFPYALLVTIFHLATAHLIWRVILRSGANPWLTTAATFLFIVLGAGAENILWAFQIGFIGGLGFGLLAFYLASSAKISRPRFVAVVAISVFSLTWSGTALPLFVVTSLILWRRTGWRRAAIHFGITAGVYLVWYITSALGNPGNPSPGPLSANKFLLDIPAFLSNLFGPGFQTVFPILGLGTEILVAVGVWAVYHLVVRRRVPLGGEPAFLLALAGLIFAGLSAYTRSAFPATGSSSRYVYTITLLFLPILVLALSQWVGARRWAMTAAVILILLVSASQAAVLRQAAGQQAQIELGSKRVISAALHLYITNPGAISLVSVPDPRWAPDLTMRELVGLYKEHAITVQLFDRNDLRRAETNLGYKG